jgi:hypothetical protein
MGKNIIFKKSVYSMYEFSYFPMHLVTGFMFAMAIAQLGNSLTPL